MSMVREVCLIVVLIFITSEASKLSNKQNELLSQRTKRSDQSLNYRLPNNSLPISYDLWIMTDIHKSDLKFNGRVKIRIKIIEESETITIHSRDIIITKVDLYDKEGNLNKSSLEFKNSAMEDFLVIMLPSFLNVDDEIMLDIDYHGNMTNNETSGLYATSYQDEANEKVWMAATHFLPISARKAFPCYDEPQIRVPIKLQIQHDKSYHALSNMPVSSNQFGISNVTTTFFETPPIPTYLLAFVVSDLDFIANKNGQIEQKIYGEPLKIRNGTAKFALKTVDEVLNKFIEVLPISLELMKLDHVGIPLFSGGIEHYGLITYEESFLLLDENGFNEEVLQYFKPQIIGAIAHCIAHQYFGSIVSNAWWQYLWLNEGITIFFQYHISNLLYPEYEYMNLFQDLIVQPLYSIDVGLKDAINDFVETPTEIDQKFNSFVVEKSAVIIRMFYEALSPSTFTKGLTIFLNDMRFKAANSLDLHKALQKAYDDDKPNNNLNISKLMSSWEEQPGYPVISIRKSGNDVIITQKRFPDEKVNDFYAIPLTFATKTNPNFDEKTAKVWMTSEVIKLNEILSTLDEWIIFNIQLVGYYRVDYSRELWDVIIKGYKANFQIIHHVNRKVLHEEIYLGWSILKTKTASDCLEFMSVLEYETSGVIWRTASYYLEQLHKFLLFSDVYENFQTKMHEILKPHIKILKASKSVDTEFPVEIKRWSMISQHPEFLELQLSQLLIYMQTNLTSDKPDLCSALSIANETIYRHYINEVINFEFLIDMEVIGGLGCSFNRTLLEEMFTTFLNPINEVEPIYVTNIMEVTVESSVVGLETVMDLISDKWWEISNLQPEYINTIVTKTHQLINSPKHLEKFKTLTSKLVQNRAILPALVASQLKTIGEKLEDEEWKNIKEWFGVEEEQTSSSSTITSTSQIEDTTLDAVSLSTSIRIIAICISLCFLLKQKFT
ncbi:unnamed protein product [Chironomus riparius]|uniref:Aminopeptidase n=1 Tax=Chironomus riparius TaxID=315576 RepID=A0A9N9WNK9_9DIPT|nr:unnamed protein product [Chironomus riparius]